MRGFGFFGIVVLVLSLLFIGRALGSLVARVLTCCLTFVDFRQVVGNKSHRGPCTCRRTSAPALEFGQRIPGQRMPAANESTPSAACVLVPSALRLVCCFGAGQVTRSEREKKLFNILGARFWPDFGQISAVSLLKQFQNSFHFYNNSSTVSSSAPVCCLRAGASRHIGIPHTLIRV